MMYSDLDDDDLRYLQGGDFIPGPFGPWIRSSNPFEQRLAKNLRPRQLLLLDLDTMVRVIATAAIERRRSEILIFDLYLQGERPSIAFISSYMGMPSICADSAGNLLPALRWYRARGALTLRVAVCAADLFWFPLMRSGGTHESL